MGTIAMLGGTGPEGLGLAMRFAAAGEAVVIGSRAVERAREAAARVEARVPGAAVEAAENTAALARAAVVVLAFPPAGLVPFLDAAGGALAGRLVVDPIVPLAFAGPFCDVAPLPGARSVGELIQARCPAARVVSAFKNVPAPRLLDVPTPLEGDCILCGEDAEARADVARLVRRIPRLRPVDAGGIASARHLEALTALQINVNRRHRAHTAVAFLGLPG